MGIRTLKPTSPARRYMTLLTNEEITKKTPEKSLLSPKKRTNGRNVYGRITVRHRGGGHKRMLRDVDFRREKIGIPAVGQGHRVRSGPLGAHRAPALQGRREALHHRAARPQAGRHRSCRARRPISCRATRCRSGTSRSARFVHNVELQPGKGGQLCRSAGTLAQLLAKEGDHANLKLPSGEVRQVKLECMATVGQVGNLDHENVSVGQGRARALEGLPADRSRNGDESRRPSDGRRRGQGQGQPSR